MVGVRSVAEPQNECDAHRHEQRRAVEQPGEPMVHTVDEPEQEVEAHGAADFGAISRIRAWQGFGSSVRNSLPG
jgi:hypothetical protein